MTMVGETAETNVLAGNAASHRMRAGADDHVSIGLQLQALLNA